MRRLATREKKPLCMIYYDGQTEYHYFETIRMLLPTEISYRMNVQKTPDSASRFHLVFNHVKKHRPKTDDEQTTIWIVSDVDDVNPNLLQNTLAEVEKENFRAALSNPCFEIWLLWHFVDCAAPVSVDKIQKLMLEHSKGAYNPRSKTCSFKSEAFKAQMAQAKTRAERASSSENVWENNPSSRVFELTSFLIA
jgi:RloB-like protein